MADKEAIPVPQVDPSTITPIDVPGIESAAHGIDMSIIGMFMHADLVVKSVIIMLLLASFWGWTIIFDKWVKFHRIRKKMAKFEDEIWSAESLEAKYEQYKHSADNPIARVFVAGMFEWMRSLNRGTMQQAAAVASVGQNVATLRNIASTKVKELKAGIKERVFHAMDTARNREIAVLERNLNFLATVGSTAPFVGLFGTVWGIMNSFQSIALTKNTTLSVVAPGIAEALFATAIGLFAAIPSVIFYNKFANDVAVFADKTDDFVSELGGVMARELDD